MLTSDVPYSGPSHNHNAPDHGMQTHHSIYLNQLFKQILALENSTAAGHQIITKGWEGVLMVYSPEKALSHLSVSVAVMR